MCNEHVAEKKMKVKTNIFSPRRYIAVHVVLADPYFVGTHWNVSLSWVDTAKCNCLGYCFIF